MKMELRIGLDLDGTLIETGVRHKAALLQAANSVGVELPPGFSDTYYEEKRNGLSGKQVLLHHGIPMAEEISKAWVDVVEDECLLGMDRLYPFVANKLKRMISTGAQFYLVTARQHEARALRQIEALRISSLMRQSFVVRISGEGESESRKHGLTRHLQLDAVVGDSEVDQAWAQEAGICFYAVECGIRCQRFWQRRGIVSYETTLLALEHLFRVPRNPCCAC
jgi:phosphoglycolate phosphatase-like HAD superfamily hydrolase